MKTYKVINGTSYDIRTPDEVIRVLEHARANRTRLHVSLGNTDGDKAGLDWLEEFDSHGYLGRSTGSIKVPLLVANSRSLGGGALLDHCIVRIRQSAGGGCFGSILRTTSATWKFARRPSRTPCPMAEC